MTRPAVLLGLLASIVACSSTTATIAQADRDARDLARGAITLVGADPARATDSETNPVTPCVSEWDFESTGQERARHSFDLAGLPVVDIPRRAGSLEQYARGRGFELTARQTIDGEVGFYFENSAGATFSVRLTPTTAVVISQSPCVWPNGTPP